MPGSKDGLVKELSPKESAYLYDFDIDGFKLKKNHTNWLDLSIGRLMTSPVLDWNVFLDGSASYTGESKHNVALSNQRLEEVAKYLKSKLASKNLFIIPHAFGYAIAAASGKPQGKEDPRDRNVLVVVKPKSEPKPPAPPPPQVVIKLPDIKVSFVHLSTEFQIRLIRGVSGSPGGPSADLLRFEIWDTINNIAAFYNFVGVGFSPPVSPLPGSATTAGPWNDFETEQPMSVIDFDVIAEFMTAGGGSVSANLLHLSGLSDNATIPNPIRLNTGTTIGFGASTTVGKMFLFPLTTIKRSAPSP